MLTLAVVATKGGVGKTTLAAHLAGLLRDIGLRVLLVDCDVQPSLTKFFIINEAPKGLTDMVIQGFITDEHISRVELPPPDYTGHAHNCFQDTKGRIDIVASDTRNGRLQNWLINKLDWLVRISHAIRHPSVTANYDICIIDTQGAVGFLQDASVNAADILVAPVSPDVISAREFIDGTIQLLDRHESTVNLGCKVPQMKAVINRFVRTNDSRLMSELIREQFLEMKGRVTVLETVVPDVTSFRKAATAHIPVHWIDPEKAGVIMHQLMWELIPSLRGQFAANHPQFDPQSAHSAPSVDAEETRG